MDLRKGDFESLLNFFQHLFVFLTADERNRETFGTKSACTTDPVQVRIGVGWKIIIDRQIYTLDINTTSKDIRGNADTLVEFLEFLVSFDPAQKVSVNSTKKVKRDRNKMTRFGTKKEEGVLPFFLADTRMNCDAREVAFP